MRRASSSSTVSICSQIVSALEDNYMFLGNCGDGRSCFLVDPADPRQALEAAKSMDLEIAAVLTTHKHDDHTAGNRVIAQALPGIPIYGPAECDSTYHAISHIVKERDIIEIGATKITVLDTPYHTAGHVSYFAEQEGAVPALFCGDALFVGGCGRFFEGNGADMVATFDKIFELPTETEVFCGHEYTESNLRFALSVDPENDYLLEKVDRVTEWRERGLPSLPSTLGEELSTNPFARLNHRAIRKAVKSPDSATEADVASLLRDMKDKF